MIRGEVNWTGKEILLKGSFDSTHNDLLSDKNIIEKPVRNSNQQNQENSSIPQMHVTVQPFFVGSQLPKDM